MKGFFSKSLLRSSALLRPKTKRSVLVRLRRQKRTLRAASQLVNELQSVSNHGCQSSSANDDSGYESDKQESIEETLYEHQAASDDLDASSGGNCNVLTGDSGYGSDSDSDSESGSDNDENNAEDNNDPALLLDQKISSETLQQGPVISAEWESVVQSLVQSSPNSVIYICGGKNNGKSTFARYLLNSLLKRYTKVGFLDTDVGQPELTPPGCLSLHVLDKTITGLPGLEMKNPVRCYFFGDVSPKTNPEDYLDGIFSLYDYFYSSYRLNRSEMPFPLVINTHGWIQGIGFDCLVDTVCHIKPTHVVQILSHSEKRNLPQNHFWDFKAADPFDCELLYVHSALGERTELAEIKHDARELRDLRLVSYFQNGLADKTSQIYDLRSVFKKTSSALVHFKPFQVQISAIKIVNQHHQIPATELIYSLNAAIVGLGVSSDGGNNKTIVESESKPICIGLGIIRAVDVQNGLFYVIAPLPLEKMQQVNTFLQGRIEIPVPLLQAPDYISPYLCRNTICIEGTGSAAMGTGRKKMFRT